MGKNSFRDPLTQVLKAHGFVTTNAPGDIQHPEDDAFNLEPGRWRWDGSTWVAVPPAPPSVHPLITKIDATLESSLIPQVLKDLLLTWRNQL